VVCLKEKKVVFSRSVLLRGIKRIDEPSNKKQQATTKRF
jgi:hypothetical protein